MNNTPYTKEFLKLFDEMCYKKGLNRRSAWSDLMLMAACDISNITEVRKDIKEYRVKLYKECEERLGGSDIPSKLLGFVIGALSENPAQDFLGEVYMHVGMGEKGFGQFFTPYHVGSLMARMSIGDTRTPIKENGFVSVADPCVGSGVMLLAAADIIRNEGLNVSESALFYGQDIDETAVNMAYIQMALLGCAAVIAHGDSLSEPYTGNPLFVEDGMNLWYTPVLFADTWNRRRISEISKLRKSIA